MRCNRIGGVTRLVNYAGIVIDRTLTFHGGDGLTHSVHGLTVRHNKSGMNNGPRGADDRRG